MLQKDYAKDYAKDDKYVRSKQSNAGVKDNNLCLASLKDTDPISFTNWETMLQNDCRHFPRVLIICTERDSLYSSFKDFSQ